MTEQRPSNIALRQLCKQKMQLLVAYQEATTTYSDIVKELAGLAGAVIHTEFAIVEAKVRAARRLSIEARERLTRHCSEHQC